MNKKPVESTSPRFGGNTFPFANRLERFIWNLAWSIFVWTPPGFMPLRRKLLTLFGATIHETAMIHSSARIWLPRNLKMDAYATIGPRVNCYNMAMVTMEMHSLISQGSHICCGSHDIDDPEFPLYAKPIWIERNAWIAADAFVGPGVRVGQNAVVGARGVTFKDVAPEAVVAGNPARFIRRRAELS